jgi:Undecaprenyl-phosphate glucose phosphotransferase
VLIDFGRAVGHRRLTERARDCAALHFDRVNDFVDQLRKRISSAARRLQQRGSKGFSAARRPKTGLSPEISGRRMPRRLFGPERIATSRLGAAAPGGARFDWNDWMPRTSTALLRGMFGAGAALADVLVIMASAVAVGAIYHQLAYGWRGPLTLFVELGFLVSLLFVTGNLMRDEYSIANYLQFAGHGRRSFALWNIVTVCVLAFGFLTKTTAETSRATILLFYLGGFASVMGARAALVHYARAGASAGSISARRVFLVGPEAEIEGFAARYQPWESGMHVVAASVLRGSDTLDEDLALAAASARMLRPDDVFILSPWSQRETIDACIDAFVRVPASIHLGPERVLDRFADAQISKVGAVSSLHIVRRPLSTAAVAAKRVIDLTLASFALVILAPLFTVLAIAIKLDSRGPVFFLQRRYGFNQEPFRIVKFRSMTTLDDGRHIVQAQPGDARVTRIGRFMRRTNIDELPQLLNVFSGQMSLVGPRPHALAHDQMYEQTIAFYARRHNVRPGITGWAQVNGFRGDTTEDEKMRARVEHDLHYIDNWSMFLDLKILFLTIFSRKAYRNAV